MNRIQDFYFYLDSSLSITKYSMQEKESIICFSLSEEIPLLCKLSLKIVVMLSTYKTAHVTLIHSYHAVIRAFYV